MTAEMKFILACTVFVSFVLDILCTLIIMTIAFPKVREIETLISAATLNPSSGRNIWGGDPFGRLIRTTQVFTFLSVRNIPGHFRRAAGKVGDVDAEIPRHLFLWGFLPTFGLFLFGGIAFCIGFIIR
ncbi:hypothetical protein ACTXGQ_10620 [Marinobacter sp. 1Y8]